MVTNLRATAYLTLPGIHKGGNCRYNGRILNPQWARSKPDTENNYHCKADIYIEWDIKGLQKVYIRIRNDFIDPCIQCIFIFMQFN